LFPADRSTFEKRLLWQSSCEFNKPLFSNSVKDEGGNFKVPKTVALDERTNDFEELRQERGVSKIFVIPFFK
jgi:hypothetical protein